MIAYSKIQYIMETVFLSRANRFIYQENSGKFFHFKEFKQEYLEKHLKGEARLGVVPDLDNKAIFGCFDIDFKLEEDPDNETKINEAKKILHSFLVEDGFKPVLELSKSGTGYHVWLPFLDYVDRKQLQKYLLKKLILSGFGTQSKNGVIEIFPKGAKGGTGVWLPLFNTITGEELDIKDCKSVFVDLDNNIDIKTIEALPNIAEHNLEIFKKRLLIPDIPKQTDVPPCFISATNKWTKGYRNGFTFAISGIAKKELNWELDKTLDYVKNLVEVNKDTELNTRTAVIENTYNQDKEVAGCSIMQGKHESITLPNTFCDTSCYIYQRKIKQDKKDNNEKEEKPNTHMLALSLLEKYKVFTEALEGLIWIYNEQTGLWSDNGNEFLQNYLETSDFISDKYKTTNFITNIIGSVRRLTIDLSGQGFPEADPKYIPFKNGVYNLEENHFEPYTPEMYMISQLPWNYNPKANSSKVEQLIRGFSKTPQKIYELLAAILYRDYNKCQYMWFLKGSGANGKSLFMRVIRTLVGDKNISALSLDNLINNRFMLSNLYNKWVNDGQELPITTPIDKPNMLKGLTGDYLEADRKYVGTIKFKNNAKLIFYGNHLPKTMDTSKGFFRRVIVIDFPFAYDKLKEDDPRHKLVKTAFTDTQMEGLAYRALQELKKLYLSDFKLMDKDDSWQETARRYEEESNPLKKFIDYNCIVDMNEECFIAKYEFKDAFNAWMTKTGMSNPYNRDNEFYYAMKDIGFEDQKRTFYTDYGPKRYNAWINLRWRTEEEKVYEAEGEDPPPIHESEDGEISYEDDIEVKDYLKDNDVALGNLGEEVKSEEIVMGKISTYLDSLDTFSAFIDKVDTFCLDIETYSDSGTKDDNVDPFRNKVRVISVGNTEEVYAIDITQHKHEDIKNVLIKLKDKNIIGHNVKFDLTTLAVKFGSEILPTNIYDTSIGSNIAHSIKGFARASNKLGDIVEEFLGIPMDKTEQKSNWGYKINKLADRVKLEQIVITTPHYAEYAQKQLSVCVDLTDEQVLYAKRDVQYLIPLMKKQIDIINKTSKKKAKESHFSGTQDFITCIEMQLIRNIVNITLAGISVNSEELNEIERQTMIKYEDLRKEIQEVYGINNPNSTQQILEFLQKEKAMVTEFDPETKLEVLVPIKDTSEETLEKTNHPIAKKVLELRGHLKLSGMIKNFTNLHEDGKLHPNFNQLIATGRMACSSPNLQQIPREIKKKFYKQNPGKVIKAFDYPTIELRVLATFLYENYGDRTMVENFKQNIDPHRATAAKMFKVELEEVTPEQRQVAKAVNFGFSYGMGALRFLKNSGLDISLEEAEEFKKKFKQGVPILYTWHNDAADSAKNNEVTPVKTLAGRILAPKNFNDILNFPIQGTGGDITKYAINIFYNLLEEYDLVGKVNIINVVHDEIIIEADQDYTEVAEAFLKQAMQTSADYILKYFTTVVD